MKDILIRCVCTDCQNPIVSNIRQIYDIRDNNLRQLTWKTEIYDSYMTVT